MGEMKRGDIVGLNVKKTSELEKRNDSESHPAVICKPSSSV
jgi:hypothetical protein